MRFFSNHGLALIFFETLLLIMNFKFKIYISEPFSRRVTEMFGLLFCELKDNQIWGNGRT
jgi:hypothetical protein